MIGMLFTGQLILVDTEMAEIQLKDREQDIVETIILDQDMKNVSKNVWKRLIGSEVEVVVIDDKATSVYIPTDEE